MRRGLAALLVLACDVGCRQAAPIPGPLFESRVPLEPLVVKLRASGGDAGRILHPAAAADLASLEAGKRYKFVALRDGRLAVAPMPMDAPSNEYVHPILAGGAPVRTAGGLRVDREGAALRKVTVDQDSMAYCPSASSLEAALAELARLGVAADVLRVENRPPACASLTDGPQRGGPRYGELMAEAGRRFELLGRAARARRFDLAAFELTELKEVFETGLPAAEPPRVSGDVNLASVVQSFAQTNLPELTEALRSQDAAAIRGAFGRAAEVCNGCHRSSGHAFIEIPGEPGTGVPRLELR